MHSKSKFYLIFTAMPAFSLLFHKSKFDDVCVGFTDDFFSSFSSGGTLHSFSVDCMQLSVVLWIKAPYPQRSITCLMVLKRTALYLVIRPNYLFINLLVFLFIYNSVSFQTANWTNCLGVSETQRLKLLVTLTNLSFFCCLQNVIWRSVLF